MRFTLETNVFTFFDQIFSYVDVTDLARCACVCRSWKVLTQASALWSRVSKRITTQIEYSQNLSELIPGWELTQLSLPVT